MRSKRLVWLGALGALLIASLLAACGGEEETADTVPPAVKEPIDGTDRYRLVLTDQAVTRLDIQTDVVAATDSGLSVPSAALVVDPTGTFWIYTSPEARTYVRAEVSPVREEGEIAHFTIGPPSGTTIVVVGVAELYGEETGVGK